MRERPRVRVGADVGGTFTDVVLQSETGEVRLVKVLSTPPDYDRAVVEAVREILGDDVAVAEVVHGTTVATNAVLEKLGARTAIVTTQGFRDVLELRRMRMPHLYDYFWRKPRRARPAAAAVRGRRAHVGLGRGDARAHARGGAARSRGSSARPRWNRLRSACCTRTSTPRTRSCSARCCARSSRTCRSRSPREILREQQEYERTATTAVNAYIRPLMAGYVENIRSRDLGGRRRRAAPDHAVVGRRHDRRRRGGAARLRARVRVPQRASSPRSGSRRRSGSRT